MCSQMMLLALAGKCPVPKANGLFWAKAPWVAKIPAAAPAWVKNFRRECFISRFNQRRQIRCCRSATGKDQS